MVNSPSQRFPFASQLEGQPEGVQDAHRYAFSAIKDVNDAVISIKSQIEAVKVAMPTAAVSTPVPIVTSMATPFAGLGTVNDQTGSSSYTLQSTDNGALLVFNSPTAVSVALNSTVKAPFFAYLTSYGAGTVTCTPSSGTVNGAAFLNVVSGSLVLAVFDGTNWKSNSVPILPVTIAPVAGSFLSGYTASTGVFSQAAPVGYSGTIVTPQLSAMGARGSQTYANGLLVSQIAAT